MPLGLFYFCFYLSMLSFYCKPRVGCFQLWYCDIPINLIQNVWCMMYDEWTIYRNTMDWFGAPTTFSDQTIKNITCADLNSIVVHSSDLYSAKIRNWSTIDINRIFIFINDGSNTQRITPPIVWWKIEILMYMHRNYIKSSLLDLLFSFFSIFDKEIINHDIRSATHSMHRIKTSF